MEPKVNWHSQRGFLYAVIGSAIGLGNLWRFPYVAYENGGSAFFLPYVLAMLSVGLPILIMEFAFGHHSQQRAPRAFSQLHRRFSSFGWFQVCLTAVIALYYSVILAWVLSFFVYAFDQSWGIDTNFFFFRHYLHLFSKTELHHWYSPQWHIISSLFVVWLLCFIVIKLGLNKGIERLSRYVTPLFMVLVLLLMVRVCFLPGAWIGIKALFTPDLSLLAKPKVWSAAYGQVFFSLGLGLSVMIAYASFLPKKANLNQSALIAVLANGVFSFVCAILVFGMLGVLAFSNSQPIENIVTAGIGLTFVTLPAAINLLPMPTVIGPIFFLGLFLMGFSSQLSLLQTLLSSLEDRSHQQPRIPISIKICLGGFFIAVFLTGANGILLIDVIDYFTNQIALVFSGLVELLIIAWLYPANALRQYTNNHSKWAIPSGTDLCLKLLCPALLAGLLLSHTISTLFNGYANYPHWDSALLGWGNIGVLILSAMLLNKKTTP